MSLFQSPHTLHIPVMGLGFTLETPLKVARYGISSAVSVMDDMLLEDMRRILCEKHELFYQPVPEDQPDGRAVRIRNFLNLLHELTSQQMEALKREIPGNRNDIDRYFDMLPEAHPLKHQYAELLTTSEQQCGPKLQALRAAIKPGSIDVNIMTRIDKLNTDKKGNPLGREYSDALAALRGFAQSKLSSCVVFSAGLNPALFSYLETFPDFFPDENGRFKKGIILKVSDFRSAMIQGKFLAKKGLWVNEFRIESGLNCGGHAFATDGLLIGNILQEFNDKRAQLREELFNICQKSLSLKGKPLLSQESSIRVTYQGGVGTAEEHRFLLEYYGMDAVGWGSPFLLVPEATSVDRDTLDRLKNANPKDYYLSNASPLGVLFHNLRNTTSEQQRRQRIDKSRPGSPCYKKLLSFNTEFSDKPVCTASREYQARKVKQFQDGSISREALDLILEKDCLCEGLGASAILVNGVTPKRKLKAVTICPGPNLAYFRNTYTLKEMTDHIYGRRTLELAQERPCFFIKELELYIEYLKTHVLHPDNQSQKNFDAQLTKFTAQMESGIQYYRTLIADPAFIAFGFSKQAGEHLEQANMKFQEVLNNMRRKLEPA